MQAATAPQQITRGEFQAISRLLHEHTGIRLVPGKEMLVMGRLDKRLRQLGLSTYRAYLSLLRQPEGRAELGTAVDLLTTNETFFFREERHFEFLRQVVVLGHREPRPLRLWSAACSSGEEAYTAAMVAADAKPHLDWEIVGTDISSRMVATAQRGIYPLAAAERIPAALLRRYCRKGHGECEGMMAVNGDLRKRVTFRQANLLGNLRELGRFDLIFLRNVMIYFDLETKRALVPRLADMLYPCGHLVVSLSETLNGIRSGLRLVGPSVYRREGGRHE